MADFGILILQIAWLFLPAACANMGAGFVRRLQFLNYPLDFGKSIGGKRIFGDHKTVRGIVFGTLAAIAMVFIQKSFFPYTISIAIIDYSRYSVWFLGVVLGTGALLGDLIRSFFKRRVNIVPGAPWFPFDQLDWVVGTIIALSFLITIPWLHMLIAAVIAVIFHPLVNYLSYRGGLQKNKL